MFMINAAFKKKNNTSTESTKKIETGNTLKVVLNITAMYIEHNVNSESEHSY